MRDLTAMPKPWMGVVITIRRGYVRRADDGSYTDLSGSGNAPGARVADFVRKGWASVDEDTREVSMTDLGDAAVLLADIGGVPLSVQRAAVLVDRETIGESGSGRLTPHLVYTLRSRRFVDLQEGRLTLTERGQTVLTALRLAWMGVRTS